MTLSKGSQVEINYYIGDKEEQTTITASLEEDVNLNLSSSFSQLVGDNASNIGTVVGGFLNAVGSFGGSTQFKQMGYQIWQKTEPIGFSLTLGFYRKTNAKKDIAKSVQTLLKMPLPGERSNGMLIPPGPSILEALGLDKGKVKRSAIDLKIGGLSVKDCIMISAEPTYSKYQDSSNYPIWVKVACSFKTMFTGTQKMLDLL